MCFMNYIYVLQDYKSYVVGATYEERKAMQICKEKGWTYRMIPFYSCEGTEIKVIAGQSRKNIFPVAKGL